MYTQKQRNMNHPNALAGVIAGTEYRGNNPVYDHEGMTRSVPGIPFTRMNEKETRQERKARKNKRVNGERV